MQTLSRQWFPRYAPLHKAKLQAGPLHCDVPIAHEEEGAKLGDWLSSQRKAYKLRGMSEEKRKANATRLPLSDAQVEALEALGVVWEPLAAQWERMRGLLLVYREREGHCDVPRTHVEEGARLGDWLSRQRLADKEARRQEQLQIHLVHFRHPCHSFLAVRHRQVILLLPEVQ